MPTGSGLRRCDPSLLGTGRAGDGTCCICRSNWYICAGAVGILRDQGGKGGG